MKTFVLCGLICAGLSCLGPHSAEAALPLYEPFDYTPIGANLTGSSPDGGVTAWQSMGAVGSGPIVINSGSLSISGLAPSIGNSIVYGGEGFTNRIPLGVTITTGTVYYSFAMQVNDLGDLDTTGGFIAGFNNATGSVTNQPTQIGARLIARANGAGYQIGIHKQSTAAGDFLFDDRIWTLGETLFVVASYTFNSVTTSDDEAWLWINPEAATFGAASAPAPTLQGKIIGTDLGQIQSFLFRQTIPTLVNVVPGAIVADELRVDTTWAGVTPVPEPSSVLLLSLVGGSALLMRRRKLRG